MSLCGPATTTVLTARPPGAEVCSLDVEERPVREKLEYAPLTGKFILTNVLEAPATNDRCPNDDEQRYHLLKFFEEEAMDTNKSNARQDPLHWQNTHVNDFDQETWSFASTNDDDDFNFWGEEDNLW